MSKQQQILVRLPDDLAQAAMRLNEVEAKSPVLEAEAFEWVNATLADADADFDADVFLRQFEETETLQVLKPIL